MYAKGLRHPCKAAAAAASSSIHQLLVLPAAAAASYRLHVVVLAG